MLTMALVRFYFFFLLFNIFEFFFKEVQDKRLILNVKKR